MGRYGASPNPLVGAVIVKDGEMVSEGHHRLVGGPHAERDALRGADPTQVRGATLYANLEPCSHEGRTPPCADAIVEAGVARVVVSHLDPNPEVAGQGIKRLRSHGLRVDVGGRAAEACRLNSAFLTYHTKRRPSVTVKWAMSLDGKIATRNGESQWISSTEGRQWALALREEHDAILVGSGTVLADDPRLNRRLDLAEGEIVRVVLDGRLRTPPNAALLSSPGSLLIFTREDAPGTAVAALATQGAEVRVLRDFSLHSILAELGKLGLQSLLVEGGGEILQSFVGGGLFERVEVCCAPKLIGGKDAPGPLGGQGVDRLASSSVISHLTPKIVGPDVVLSGVRSGLEEELLERVLPPEGRA